MSTGKRLLLPSKDLMVTKHERLPRHSMQIAAFAHQATGNRTNPAIQHISTANKEMEEVSQHTCILKRSEKCVRNDQTRSNHVSLLDEFSRPFTSIMNQAKPDKIYLLMKQNYKIFVNIVPFFRSCAICRAFLDTKALPDLL